MAEHVTIRTQILNFSFSLYKELRREREKKTAVFPLGHVSYLPPQTKKKTLITDEEVDRIFGGGIWQVAREDR